MKRTLSMVMVLALMALGLNAVAAGAKDSLILNDGKVITGTISDKTLEAFDNMQFNINTGNTLIDEGSGKPTKVPNKDVKYFILNGVKYANIEMVGGNKIVLVLLEGKASLYYWSGTVTIAHTRYDRSTPNVTQEIRTENKHPLAAYVLVLNGKNINPKTKYLEKNFETIFSECKSLVAAAKAGKVDYDDTETIVKKYNHCD